MLLHIETEAPEGFYHRCNFKPAPGAHIARLNAYFQRYFEDPPGVQYKFGPPKAEAGDFSTEQLRQEGYIGLWVRNP